MKRISVLAVIFFSLSLFADAAIRRNGKIAFTSDRDGNREIYVMNADGSNQTRLTNNSLVDDHAIWSPDGSQIAFVSEKTVGSFAIFVMNVDGSGKTEVTPIRFNAASYPINDLWGMSWSPDGSRIVFQQKVEFATGPAYPNDIYVVNVDGSNKHILVDDPADARQPTWSPDGSKILFVSNRDDDPFYHHPYTIRPDGTGLQPLVPFPEPLFGERSPSWSPSGNTVAYQIFDWANFSGVGIANADGTNAEYFDYGDANRDKPAWSPDGRSIIFHVNLWDPVVGWYDTEIFVKRFGVNVLEPGVQLTNSGNGNFKPSWQPMPRSAADFDGDGRSDVSVFRPSDSVWYLSRSAQGFSAVQFGLATDTIVPGDYDGDGKTDVAIFRQGTWWRVNSGNATVEAVQFGQEGDIPVPADYSGDGRDEVAIYRNGEWWTYDISSGESSLTYFGLPTDNPVPADYDGDGRIDQAVYRDGEWHLNRSAQGYTVFNFGLDGDRPLTGDFDGDFKADLAVYRDGMWYLQMSAEGFAAFPFGLATDIPVPADYDGDGKADAAVFRNGTWYVNRSTGGVSTQQFGISGDKPVQAANL